MISLKNLTTMLTRVQNLTTMLVTTVLHRTVNKFASKNCTSKLCSTTALILVLIGIINGDMKMRNYVKPMNIKLKKILCIKACSV